MIMKLFIAVKFSVCTTICIFIFNAITYAQDKSLISKAWVKGSVGSDGKKGGFAKFGVQTVFKDRWIGSISYYKANMDLKGVPANYKTSSSSFFDLEFHGGKPSQNLHVTNITAVKFGTVGRSIFFSGSARLSVVNGDKASF